MLTKSKIIDKKPIPWGLVIVINDLYANESAIASFKDQLIIKNPNITKDELDKEIQNLVMKDNFYNKVMGEISNCYEFEFSDEELQEKKMILKQTYEDASDEQLDSICKSTIVKFLIYEDLSIYWGIEITDDMAKASLENFYKLTGDSIKEYLEDRSKFENIKSMIKEQIITERILNAFKGKFSLKNNNN